MEKELPAVDLSIEYVELYERRALESVPLAIIYLLYEKGVDYLVALVVRLEKDRGAKDYPYREKEEDELPWRFFKKRENGAPPEKP